MKVKNRSWTRSWTRVLVLSALALSILATDSHSLVVGSKELRSCHLPGYRQEVLCGTHTVFEDRSAAKGREIEIHFAVIPAVGENPRADPVLVFAGGPGQSAIEMAPFVADIFSEVKESRSVILIDQRGIGSSHPLDCETPEEEVTLSLEEQALRARQVIGECLEQWDADVKFYTQDLANQDIHDILLALGYQQANLYGASWGTRSALLFAHQFPDQVRTILLDGALPLRNTAPLYAAEDAERALRALFADCATDPACQKAFPALEDTFHQAMKKLEGSGISVEMKNPSTGEPLSLVMTQEDFGGILRSILYLPELSRIVPSIIQQASVGHYEALMGVASVLEAGMGNSMTPGASLAIFCSEELARIDESDLEQGKATLLGQAFFDGLWDSCDVWPKAPLPPIYNEEVGSHAPTLILSGAIDPITPPRWGDAISEALPNSLHLIAANTGHNVAPKGCAPELIEQFIEQGDHQDLDGACLDEIKRPSFFVHASGPTVTSHHD